MYIISFNFISQESGTRLNENKGYEIQPFGP